MKGEIREMARFLLEDFLGKDVLGSGRAWLATGTTIPVTRGSFLKLEPAW
ncbi:hypothetical protein METEAL_27470 [Mesoterricola silvestris]|uniref:Uncharacterized protein n=2 Tax=Mesoterricola silvestris TaxID=2927979 RepID=A0AA48H043_9BACT|nr:hypothetical protein METEAL_27470 [Mesoterricola silvestris]